MDIVQRDSILIVKEDEDHLLCPSSMYSGLTTAWLPLLDPLPCLSLCLRGVEGHGGLIHGDNVVQDHQGLLPLELKEVLTALDPLHFLRTGQQFGYPAGKLFFYKAKINSERVHCTMAKVRSNMAESSLIVRQRSFPILAATAATMS